MVWHEPLDLKYWLVNTLSGSYTIFILLMSVVIILICAMFKLPQVITLMAVFTFLLIVGAPATVIIFVMICLVGYVLYSILYNRPSQ